MTQNLFISRDIIKSIKSNNHRTLSRLISHIENDGQLDKEFYESIHPLTTTAIRIGITGPPGAGKSTLIDQLIEIILENGGSVGVVAVDPTSPFTGGSLLGDRVRMNQFIWNENVFIRSMGSHGNLGGLARKAQDVGDLLAASGKDIVIFETVGVGQGEFAVAKAADISVVILVPESGDEVQLMKAGLIEIADLFVINKSDREGGERLSQALQSILKNNKKMEKNEPPVLKTIANKGDGIAELYKEIFARIDVMQAKGILVEKRKQRFYDRVIDIVQNKIFRDFWTVKKVRELEKEAASYSASKTSARAVAEKIIKAVEGE